MVEQHSPLGPAWRPGAHGHLAEGAGVSLTEQQPASITQLAAWPGRERHMLDAIRTATGLLLSDGAAYITRQVIGVNGGMA